MRQILQHRLRDFVNFAVRGSRIVVLHGFELRVGLREFVNSTVRRSGLLALHKCVFGSLYGDLRFYSQKKWPVDIAQVCIREWGIDPAFQFCSLHCGLWQAPSMEAVIL